MRIFISYLLRICRRMCECSYLLALFLTIPCCSVFGQNAKTYNHAGKHFFYSIPGLSGESYDTVFFKSYKPDEYDMIFTSKHRANVRLHFFNVEKGNASIKTFVINPGEAVHYNPDNKEDYAMRGRYNPRETPDNKSLEIIADSDIVVHVAKKIPAADDGTQVLPVDNQPKISKYRLLYYRPLTAIPFVSQFALVATCDSVVLKITPTGNTVTDIATHTAGVPYTITLNKGATYTLQSSDDLNGTLVEVVYSKVNVPVCIYTYYGWLRIPADDYNPGSGLCCNDYLMEQMLPVNWWDTLTPVNAWHLQKRYRLRIMSDDYNNAIYLDNHAARILQPGKFLDTLLDRAVVVHSSKPAGVMQIMLSSFDGAINRVDGDPDIIWSTPASQGLNETYFRVFGPIIPKTLSSDSRVYHIVLNISSPTGNINNIRLDNGSVAGYFQPFPGDPSWQFARIPIDSLDTTTVHHLVSPQKITAYLMKEYPQGGYSYNLSEVNTHSATDTSYIYKCADAGVTLSPPVGDSYLWSNGYTTPQIYVTDTGHYRVTVYSACEQSAMYYDYFVIDSTTFAPRYIDTIVCFTDSLVLRPDMDGWNYIWADGATIETKVVHTDGIYTVAYYTAPCVYHTDTFKVAFYNKVPVVQDNHNDCNRTGDKVWVVQSPGDTTVYAYVWKDASDNILRTFNGKGDTLYAAHPGAYTLSILASNGCLIDVPFTVEPKLQATFTGPSIVCEGDSVSFTPEYTGAIVLWHWDFGDGETATVNKPTHVYAHAGDYKIMLAVSDAIPCNDTVYASIQVLSKPRISFTIDKDSICTGEPVMFTPVNGSSFEELAWQTHAGSIGYNGALKYAFDHAGEQVVTLIGKHRYCKNISYSDTIHVWPYPVVNLRADTSLCPGETSILLENLASAQDGIYQWSTGSAEPGIKINLPGNYWLRLTSIHGCTASDTVLIASSCYIVIPNAFTPNGDGVNDYFFPRDLLGAGIVDFNMHIFNRWGEKIFETNKANGRGWDGTFNNIKQMEGVYVYLINVSFRNGADEKYKGNVTLIR